MAKWLEFRENIRNYFPSLDQSISRKRLLFFFAVAYTVVLVRTAWMCDDAYITLRTIDNFVQGYGLVWNVGERVQAYTHPLWMFLVSAFYALTREPYYTTLIISMLLSLSTAVLLLWVSRDNIYTLSLVGLLLVGSKAFVDYSTSGLENPLAHLLLAVFFIILCSYQQPTPRQALSLGVLAGLVMFNRLDHSLLVIPGLLATALRLQHREIVRMLAAAGLPVVGWTIFSIIYYGFPFPNTFYAKQTAGIPRIEYLERGLVYLIETGIVDGLTLLGIVIGLSIALWQRCPSSIPASIGIVLYIAYVIWIGGDFMGGRMFSAPLVSAVTLVASGKATPLPVVNWVFFFSLFLVFSMSWPYLFSKIPLRGIYTKQATVKYVLGSQPDPEVLGIGGIVDGRSYHATLWLIPLLGQEGGQSSFEWLNCGKKLRNEGYYFYIYGATGLLGYYAGQNVYIIDIYALSDPFLARVGLASPPQDWRVGHIQRPIPDGYLLTRFTGRNHLIDPELAKRYEQLQLLTTGQLFTKERFAAIIDLNLSHNLFSKLRRNPEVRIDYYRIFYRKSGAVLSNRQMNILFPTEISNHEVLISAKGNYQLEFRNKKGNNLLSRQIISNNETATLRSFQLSKVDTICISPLPDSSVVVYLTLVNQEPFLCVYDLDEMEVLLQY